MNEPRLILVGTPIGNVADMSPRATQTLAEADVVAAEDTRHSGRLFKALGISVKELLSLNDHNETSRIPQILDRLGQGQTVALISDAGMPGISDPGEHLVAAVAKAGFPVEVVPGPTALITALVASGLATSRFVYEGFLPRKGKVRRQRLELLSREDRTIILYESPHRVVQTINDLAQTFGPERNISISRELTKLYEQTWRGTLAEAVDHTQDIKPRGEYVLVLEAAPAPAPASINDIDNALAIHLRSGLSKRDAASVVAQELGVSKRDAYNRALVL